MSRRMKGLLEEAQGTAELDMLEDLLRECSGATTLVTTVPTCWSLSKRDTGQKRFEQNSGGPPGDVKIRLVSKDEADLPRRKAPPPKMRESPVNAVPSTRRRKTAEELETSQGLEDLKKENLKMKVEGGELPLEILQMKRRREEELLQELKKDEVERREQVRNSTPGTAAATVFWERLQRVQD